MCSPNPLFISCLMFPFRIIKPNDFGVINYSDQYLDQDYTTSLFPFFVYEEDTLLLDWPCTKADIWEALINFAKDKSPGPDGWMVGFFSQLFELLGDDFLNLWRTRGLEGRSKVP